MAEAPDWMDDAEVDEYLTVECDECGVENAGCECITCTECLEFGVGAVTKDQNLSLCELCAEDLGVEMYNFTHARMQAEQHLADQLAALHKKE